MQLLVLPATGGKVSQSVNSAPAPIAATTADEYFISGFNKFVEPGSDVIAGKKAAIQLFSQAIRLNLRSTFAYFIRAIEYRQLQQNRLALADYDRVLALNPQDAVAYYNRGSLKSSKLNDARGALADYDRAIALNPQYASAYSNRGLLKYQQLNDTRGALADYEQAIALNPQFALAYATRGELKYQHHDRSGGIADVRQAAKLARLQDNAQILQLALQDLRSWGVGE